MGRKSNKAGVERRRRIVAALLVEGWNKTQIRDKLEDDHGLAVSRSQITRDVQAIRAEWAEGRVSDWLEAQGEELAKLAALERELWDAWRLSQGPIFEVEVRPPARSDQAARKEAQAEPEEGDRKTPGEEAVGQAPALSLDAQGHLVDQDGNRIAWEDLISGQKGAEWRKLGRVKIKASPGDPRFLQGLLSVIQTRAKLLGLNAADVSLEVAWEDLTQDQKVRIARGENPIQVVFGPGTP